jgi:hypothetical protein
VTGNVEGNGPPGNYNIYIKYMSNAQQTCLTTPTYTPTQYNDSCSKYSAWGNNNTCYNHIAKDIVFNRGSGNSTGYNFNNIEVANSIMEDAIFDYLTNGNVQGNINDLIGPSGPGLTEILYTCKNLSLTCDKILNQICIGCSQSELTTSGYTSSASPTQSTTTNGLLELCGCYAFRQVRTDVRNVCDATCDNPYAIKNQINRIDGTPDECNRTVCVIDGISVEVANAGKQGNIDIDQVCSGCGNGGCVCIINFPSNGFPNNLNVSIESDCADSVCYDSTGTKIICPDTIGVPPEKIEQMYILIAIIFFVFIIFTFVLGLIFA